MVHDDPRVSSLLLGVLLATAACQGKGTARSNAENEGAADAKAADQATADPGVLKPTGPLTQEEKDLIAADPKDLTPELRRKRAYAIRKKIMQNPDSPAARSLEELRRAALAGELDIPGFEPPEGKAKKDAKLEARKPPTSQPGEAPLPSDPRTK
jgi:hypothetical protein